MIPRLDRDLPLCIDPFLLYRSSRRELREAHALLMSVFEAAFQAFREGDAKRAARLVDFPEARAIRFGYASRSKDGRGIGQLGPALVAALEDSPELVARGFSHVEELQLVAEHIGPDRISDLAGNVLRRFLATYTADQCNLWNIALAKGVPLEHVWDPVEGEWGDTFADLPLDSKTGDAVILVPRWIVRRLPWINYQDFRSHELAAFLRPRSVRKLMIPGKPQVVKVTRRNLALVDRYVRRKEREAKLALPVRELSEELLEPEGYIRELAALHAGKPDAVEYQNLILRILNALFEPFLSDGRPQSRTAEGTEIRDIVFTNSLDDPWLVAIHKTYGNYNVLFECKNVRGLGTDDINQVANYLGDPMGYFACVVTRVPPSCAMRRKIRATYNKQVPRRTILVLTDDDLGRMLKLKAAGQSPLREMRRLHGQQLQEIE